MSLHLKAWGWIFCLHILVAVYVFHPMNYFPHGFWPHSLPALESGSMWDSSECWASCLQLCLQFHPFLYCHCVDVASVTSVISLYQNRLLCSLVSTLSLPSMLHWMFKMCILLSIFCEMSPSPEHNKHIFHLRAILLMLCSCGMFQA